MDFLDQHDMHSILNDVFCMHALEADMNIDLAKTSTNIREEHPF